MNVNIITKSEADELREKVREHYGAEALRVTSGGGCCSDSSDPISSDLYAAVDANDVPSEALLASLGCGNPTALARLNKGETVLDLGSGGGIDVLLSAKRVGPDGFAYGLDMTDEMLALAEENRKRAGAENVKFLKGIIEDIPLPDNSVDVIISNCVINLSADKGKVLHEAARVLKPGGRLAVSDVVVRGEMPAWLRQSMDAWAGCIAGALHEDEYKRLLSEAGFDDIGIEVTRTYSAADVAGVGDSCCVPEDVAAELSKATPGSLDGLVVSAFVRATKPARA